MADTVNIAVEATDNASDVLGDIGDAAEDMGKSGDKAAKDFAALSERLEGLSQAQVGRAAIRELDRALDDGRITAEQYSEAVEKIQVSSGLAAEGSMKAAEDLKLYTEQLELGEISAEEYAERVAQLSEDTDDAGDAMKGAASDTNVLQMGFTELNSALELVQKGIALFKQAFDFAKEGAEIQRIGEQFEATMAGFGISADALIDQMDRVTGRTVDDEELMQVATRAFTQELVSNAGEIVSLLEIARASATRFGGDTASAFEQIALATETGMVRSLKARGIVIDLNQVYEDYADKLGKARKELTEQEEKQARLNAVLAQGQKLVEAVGDSVEDNLSKFQRFERSISDTADEMKMAAANAFIPALDVLDQSRIVMDESRPAAERLAAAYATLGSRTADNTKLTKEAFGAQGDFIEQLREQVKVEAEFGTLQERAAADTKELTLARNALAEADREAAAAAEEAAAAEALAADQEQRRHDVLAGIAPLAIEYTARSKELAEMQAELAAMTGTLTDAELQQRDALVAQIEAFRQATEIEKATQAFDALNQAFQSGIITQEQYLDRAERLNRISGLYTDTALKEATAQQVLIDALTDPATERWYAQLIQNKTALDGIVGVTEKAATTTNNLTQNQIKTMGAISEEVFESQRERTLRVVEGLEDLSDQVQNVSGVDYPELATQSDITTETMRMGFDEVGISIRETDGDVKELSERLANIPRNIVVNVRVNEVGAIPSGGGGGGGGGTVPGQRGLDFIVPPGFPGDSAFVPLRVSSGERVIVVPQGGGASPMAGGDTVIINDRLALAQYYEQKRARLVERSAKRMR